MTILTTNLSYVDTMPTLTDPFQKYRKELLDQIYAQREEILTAFIAKYGYGPEELEQTIAHFPDKIVWRINKRGEQ